MSKCTHCGHDGETAFEACMAAELRAKDAETDMLRIHNEKVDHFEARIAAEALCKRLDTELQSAAVALEEAGKIIAAANIDGLPMKGTSTIMTGHAKRARLVLSDTAQQETRAGLLNLARVDASLDMRERAAKRAYELLRANEGRCAVRDAIRAIPLDQT